MSVSGPFQQVSRGSLQASVANLQTQLAFQLNTFNATGSQAALLAALQLQSQISQLLLGASGLSTPSSQVQFNSIKLMRARL